MESARLSAFSVKAQMAKLVDALCSGRSVRKDVLVRIQFWALGHLLGAFFIGVNQLGSPGCKAFSRVAIGTGVSNNGPCQLGQS